MLTPPHTHTHTQTHTHTHTHTDSSICPEFTNINGQFAASPPRQLGRWIEGTTVDVTCNPGYGPINSKSQLTCGSAGAWTPNTPKCLRKSPNIP